MPDTITESELTARVEAYRPKVTVEVFRDEVRRIMVDTLESVGITVVPDPIPEPEGDVIVVDKHGDPWRLRDGKWDCLSLDMYAYEWATLLGTYGPVKIFRLEES